MPDKLEFDAVKVGICTGGTTTPTTVLTDEPDDECVTVATSEPDNELFDNDARSTVSNTSVQGAITVEATGIGTPETARTVTLKSAQAVPNLFPAICSRGDECLATCFWEGMMSGVTSVTVAMIPWMSRPAFVMVAYIGPALGVRIGVSMDSTIVVSDTEVMEYAGVLPVVAR